MPDRKQEAALTTNGVVLVLEKLVPDEAKGHTCLPHVHVPEQDQLRRHDKSEGSASCCASSLQKSLLRELGRHALDSERPRAAGCSPGPPTLNWKLSPIGCAPSCLPFFRTLERAHPQNARLPSAAAAALPTHGEWCSSGCSSGRLLAWLLAWEVAKPSLSSSRVSNSLCSVRSAAPRA